MPAQVHGPMGVLGALPSIAVRGYLPPVALQPARGLQIVLVIPHRKDNLVGDQPLIHQFQGQRVRRLPQHQPRLPKFIGALEHLPGTHTAGFRSVRLDVRHGAWFPAPGVIDKQFGIDTEKLVQQLLVAKVPRLPHRAPGHIPMVSMPCSASFRA